MTVPCTWELALLGAVKPTCPTALFNLQNFLHIACRQKGHCREGRKGQDISATRTSVREGHCFGGLLLEIIEQENAIKINNMVSISWNS